MAVCRKEVLRGLQRSDSRCQKFGSDSQPWYLWPGGCGEMNVAASRHTQLCPHTNGEQNSLPGRLPGRTQMCRCSNPTSQCPISTAWPRMLGPKERGAIRPRWQGQNPSRTRFSRSAARSFRLAEGHRTCCNKCLANPSRPQMTRGLLRTEEIVSRPVTGVPHRTVWRAAGLCCVNEPFRRTNQ